MEGLHTFHLVVVVSSYRSAGAARQCWGDFSAAQGGELVGEGQGPLQPDGRAPAVLGKRVQREESPLYPGGLAPKRMRDVTMGQDGRGKQQQRGGSRGQGELEGGDKAMASGACQGSVWILVVQCWLLAGTQ